MSQRLCRDQERKRRDREQIAVLYCRGLSQRQIGEQLGLSQQMVSHDLRLLHRAWTKKGDATRQKHRTLAKLDELERSYWREWERSRKKKRKARRETMTGASGAGSKRSVEVEQRDGDPRYLRGVERCIDMRCRLLGLYAQPDADQPTGQRVTQIVVVPPKQVEHREEEESE